MKTKNLFLTAIAAFIFFTSHAQKHIAKSADIIAQEGIATDTKELSELISILGKFKNNYYVLKRYRNDYIIECFDQSSTSVWVKKFPIEINGRFPLVRYVFMHEQYIRLCFDVSDDNTGKHTFLVCTFDVLSPDAKLDIKEIGDMSYNDKKNTGFFRVNNTDHGLLLLTELPVSKSEYNIEYEIIMYDYLLQKKYEQTIIIPATHNNFRFENIQTLSDSTFFIKGRINDIPTGKTKDHYFPIFYMCHKDKKEPIYKHRFTLKDDQLYVNTWRGMISGKELVLAGFYSHYPSSANFGGSFYERIDIATGNIIAEHSDDFDMETINTGLKDYMSLKKINKLQQSGGYPELVYLLRNLLIKDDGSIILTCEDVRQYTTASTPQVASYTYNVFKNILLISYDHNGKLLWRKSVLKEQRGDETRCSFICITIKDAVYAIYHEMPSNLKPNRAHPKSNGPGGGIGNPQILIAVKFNQQGQSSREYILVQKGTQQHYQINLYGSSEKELFLFGADHKKQRACILKY